ncbi:hypothetical protein NKH18_18810 [Streptomyces sp. M10(2022)]
MPGDDRPSVRVRDLVRSVIAALAPEELPLVDGLRRFDDATVVRRLRGRAGAVSRWGSASVRSRCS